MTRQRAVLRLVVVAACAAMTVAGCSFQGLNSLPLPGAQGRGSDAKIYHVQVANVGTLESNSPVLINDVVVGSVGKMTVDKWHADVEVSVKPEAVVPENAVASVGQTSLLGSMHLALNPPLGEAARGSLRPGTTIPMSKSSTYPSTEQTLSSLSLVLNAGGLSQLGDIIHNFNGAVHGREQQIRDLLTRLDTFVGVLDKQHDDIIATIQALNRLAGSFAEQREVITDALNEIPPALDVLIKERPNLTTALTKLGTFSDTATRLANDTQDDLVRDLKNLQPTLDALNRLGPDLAPTLAYTTLYPYSTNLIDRGVRGDYANLFAVLDITRERLKRTLLLGTRFGQPGMPLPAAPGEPYYIRNNFDPVGGAAPPNAGLTASTRPDAPPGSLAAPLAQQAAPDAPPAPPSGPETPWPPSQMDVGG
ncbi:MAG: phospholipid/cholesterol/gamma-HCH transport system substrate-binding protein [Mycobacterium sp.]|jgi:virulence factor Mce-like protein|nr:phospholipid/cholesterol/gamma-HCH transport system substrate-binding protein [Mycobacterium sp.]